MNLEDLNEYNAAEFVAGLPLDSMTPAELVEALMALCNVNRRVSGWPAIEPSSARGSWLLLEDEFPMRRQGVISAIKDWPATILESRRRKSLTALDRIGAELALRQRVAEGLAIGIERAKLRTLVRFAERQDVRMTKQARYPDGDDWVGLAEVVLRAGMGLGDLSKGIRT